MFQQFRNLGRSVKEGFKKGVQTQDLLADERFGKNNRNRRYSHSVIPGLDGGYYEALGKRGVGIQTPAELAGAVGARFLTDVGDDATRHVYWRYNHPMAIGDKIAEQIVGDNIYTTILLNVQQLSQVDLVFLWLQPWARWILQISVSQVVPKVLHKDTQNQVQKTEGKPIIP